MDVKLATAGTAFIHKLAKRLPPWMPFKRRHISSFRRRALKVTNIRRLFQVDDHIGVAIPGLTADGRVLLLHMRSECIHYKFLYDSPLPIGRLVVQPADKAQVCTQRSCT